MTVLTQALTLALSKGRILDDCLPLLKAAGIAPAVDAGRLLRIPTEDPGVELLEVRPTDVPTYVEYGAADLGIVGKDILLEHGGGALMFGEPGADILYPDPGFPIYRSMRAWNWARPIRAGRASRRPYSSSHGVTNPPALMASANGGMPSSESFRKFFTNFGVIGEMPSRSCSTMTWASVSGPAPMPMTGILTASDIVLASVCGTHSNSNMLAPDSSSNRASASMLSA